MKKAIVIESPKMLVLFSYTTPVAFYDKVNQKVYQTLVKHSRTTSRHINLFFKKFILPHHLSAFSPEKVTQDKLNEMFPLTITNL